MSNFQKLTNVGCVTKEAHGDPMNILKIDLQTLGLTAALNTPSFSRWTRIQP